MPAKDFGSFGKSAKGTSARGSPLTRFGVFGPLSARVSCVISNRPLFSPDGCHWARGTSPLGRAGGRGARPGDGGSISGASGGRLRAPPIVRPRLPPTLPVSRPVCSSSGRLGGSRIKKQRHDTEPKSHDCPYRCAADVLGGYSYESLKLTASPSLPDKLAVSPAPTVGNVPRLISTRGGFSAVSRGLIVVIPSERAICSNLRASARAPTRGRGDPRPLEGHRSGRPTARDAPALGRPVPVTVSIHAAPTPPRARRTSSTPPSSRATPWPTRSSALPPRAPSGRSRPRSQTRPPSTSP